MKNNTRIVLLTILMVFSTLSGGLVGAGKAFAANEFTGSGTAGSPYLIKTADQLNLVRGNYLSANIYFKLTRNIDLSSYAAAGWAPIGTGDNPFYAHMDGNGFRITGLKIADSAKNYAGLFGYIGDGSSLTNIKLENVTISAGRFVGGLVGVNDRGTIANSYVSGSLSGTYGVGGLSGSSSGTISSSYAVGDAGGAENLGGLVGINRGTIIDSFALGDTNGTKNVGGLVGWNNEGGSIRNSHASGNTSGSENAGGLVGWNYKGEIINDSYAAGDVFGSNDKKNIGGLVGSNQNGTISNSHTSGKVSGAIDVGGLVGNDYYGEITKSYTTGNITGSADSSAVGGLVGYTEAGTISYSYSLGNVSAGLASKQYAGGLVGYNLAGIISNSFAKGEVSGYSAGGLIGSNDRGELNSSYASGKVSGTIEVGGLVGWNVLGPINSSYATGEVNGNEDVGGLVGWNVNGPINNSYASGKVIGTREAGGLVGFTYDSTSTINSFYDILTTGLSVSRGGAGKSTLEMQTKSTYEADNAHSWDFSNIWAIDPLRNGGYPYLREIQVYLDYDGNGNTGGTVPTPLSYMPGAKISMSPAAVNLTNIGYILDGWNTKADGSGSLFKWGDTYTLTSTTVLYAHWVTPSTIASLTSTIGTVSPGGTANETITAIPYGTTLAALKAAITPAAGATFEVYDADGTSLAAALTTGKKIIVTTHNGLTEATYTVSVDPGSSDTSLTSTIGTVSAGGTITDIPYGTTLAALEEALTPAVDATFEIYDANGVTPATVLATGKKVIVTSENGTKAIYTVSVIANTLATMTSAIGTVSIGGTATETINVPYGTTLTALRAAITPAGGATFEVYNADGQTVANALATGSKIIVTAENTINKVTYLLTIAKNTNATLTSTLGVVSTDGTANETIKNIPFGTTLAVFKAGITLAAGATYEIYNSNGTTVATSLQSGRKAIVTAQDGTSKVTYLLTIELNSDATMTSTIGTVSIGGSANETITVPYGTTYDTLYFAIKPAVGAQAAFYEANGTTVTTTLATGTKIVITSQNILNKVTYTVTIAANSAKSFTAFSFAEQSGAATINTTNRTVSIKVANGTDRNGLVATFALSAGATAQVDTVTQVSGTTANDFTNQVTYLVTAADNSAQSWTVTVTVAASSANALTAFSFPSQTGLAVIDATAHTVAIEVAYGTNPNGLVATFVLSAGATAKVGAVNQVSGTTANNFTNQVTYAVKAADNSTQNWKVTVTVASSSANALTAFSFAEQTGAAVINAGTHTVAIEVANGTNRSGLVATFALSAGATAKVGTVTQASGTTANDFTSQVTYVVTAADNSPQSWTVTVTVAASSANALTAFSFAEQTGAAVIDAGTHTVAIEVANGTNPSGLVATFAMSAGATAKVGTVTQASGTTANDFTSQVTYVVTAADNSPQSWTVTVTVKAAPSGGNGGGGSITPTAPRDTNVNLTNGRLTLPAGKGGEVSLNDWVIVSIPANATDKEITITIDKVTDSQRLLTNNEVLATAVYEIMKNFPENFINLVTLTFTFDPASLKSNQTVAVFYYDEVKKSWIEVTGGRINGNQITVTVNHFTKFAVFAIGGQSPDVHTQEPPVNQEPLKSLNDIAGHWAEAAIKQAIDIGIVSGYPDGTFKPNHTVTRAEFTVMLMNMLKQQGTEAAELNFTDKDKIGAWATSAVMQAVQAGYITGYQDGTFRPNAVITRAEMAVMAAKALGLPMQENTPTGFADDKDIPSWAKGAAAAMKKLALITGKGGNTFAPAANTTRAEAVTVLLNILIYNK